MSRKTSVACALATLIALSAVALPTKATPALPGLLRRPPGAALETERAQTFYVVLAHSDDELSGWSMVENRSASDYIVWVTVTRGRTTVSCHTPEEAINRTDVVEDATFIEGFAVRASEDAYRTGPYRYQGPDSPVGEPDHGESRPYGYPWQGKGSEACGDARVASWLWFLDGMSALTPTIPTMEIGDDPWADDDYQGEFCPESGVWNGDGSDQLDQTGCAEVWADENGARIALDLPEMPGFEAGYVPPAEFSPQDVADAMQTVRAKRGEWGLRILPEAGAMSGAVYADWGAEGPPLGCIHYVHPEHQMVAEALRYIDLDAGPQFGAAACAEDPLLDGAEHVIYPQNPAAIVPLNLVAFGTEQRIGPYVKHYGWLLPTYEYGQLSSTHYWKIFG